MLYPPIISSVEPEVVLDPKYLPSGPESLPILKNSEENDEYAEIIMEIQRSRESRGSSIRRSSGASFGRRKSGSVTSSRRTRLSSGRTSSGRTSSGSSQYWRKDEKATIVLPGKRLSFKVQINHFFGFF